MLVFVQTIYIVKSKLLNDKLNSFNPQMIQSMLDLPGNVELIKSSI